MTAWELANKVYETNGQLLFNLADRWDCEQAYEDIAEYAEVLKGAIEKLPDVKFQTMTKRPFGYTFRAQGKLYKIGAYRSGKYTLSEI